MKYSEEEIKRELQEFRLPWISRIWKKYGVPALRYSILPAFVIALVFGVMYNESTAIHNWMWVIVKTIVLLFILGFGIFGLLGHVFELIATNKLRTKFGLTHEEFKILVARYQTTGM
jgi:hypothetical protein